MDTPKEIRKAVEKHFIKCIKEMQAQLVYDKGQLAAYGYFDDCGDFYQENVAKTEALVDELVRQKIAVDTLIKRVIYSGNSDIPNN